MEAVAGGSGRFDAATGGRGGVVGAAARNGYRSEMRAVLVGHEMESHVAALLAVIGQERGLALVAASFDADEGVGEGAEVDREAVDWVFAEVEVGGGIVGGVGLSVL